MDHGQQVPYGGKPPSGTRIAILTVITMAEGTAPHQQGTSSSYALFPEWGVPPRFPWSQLTVPH